MGKRTSSTRARRTYKKNGKGDCSGGAKKRGAKRQRTVPCLPLSAGRIKQKGAWKANMKAGTVFLSIFLAAALILSISGCGNQPVSESPAGKTESAEVSDLEGSDDKQTDTREDKESMMQMRIGDTKVTVEWEDNESVQALRDLCSDNALTIQMSMYGGFEQVGSIGQSLPRDDQQTTTGAGDIVLYSGNQIVVFYGSNSWAYTRLGHITDQDAAGMAELLGNDDVTITISME